MKGWDGEEDQYKNLRNESALSFSSSTGEIVRRFNFNAQLNYDRNWGLHRLNTVFTLCYGPDGS